LIITNFEFAAENIDSYKEFLLFYCVFYSWKKTVR